MKTPENFGQQPLADSLYQVQSRLSDAENQLVVSTDVIEGIQMQTYNLWNTYADRQPQALATDITDLESIISINKKDLIKTMATLVMHEAEVHHIIKAGRQAPEEIRLPA